MFVSEIRTRYSETDQMGIVHHSHYINWFEVGRTDLIRSLGHSYGDIENENLLLPVINVQVFYRSPAKYEDVLVIESSISKYNGIRIIFQYKIYKKEDHTLIADGYTEHCWTNKLMRPVNLKKQWPKLHEQAVKEMEAHL